ncbi:hypothetical protein PM082_004052 [Marasmius tenuissimus]|nr:hypothetical protein PM082_004052 [Marasmius tenuissimus]
MIPGDHNCRIPFELVEQIFPDCDHESLLSCSEVCQSWLHTCRPLLFKTLKIDTSSIYRCAILASLLGSKHSTIPRYVEEIGFNFARHLLQADAYILGKEDEVVSCVSLIQSITGNLEDKAPFLRRLTISSKAGELLTYNNSNGSSYETTGIQTTFASHFVRSFGHITQLDLHFVSEKPTPLIHFICSFPRLEVLKMFSGCASDDHSDRVQQSVTRYTLPSSIKSLKLGGDDSTIDADGLLYVYQWLNAHSPTRLVNLSVHTIDVSTVLNPNIQPFLAQCQELRFLHLGFNTWFFVAGRDDTALYDLSPLHRLERLAISYRNVAAPSIDVVLLRLIRRMIATLSSSSLHRITFNVSGSGFRVVQEQWAVLDTLLSSSGILSAMEVELIIPFSDITIADRTSEEDLAKAKELFAKCGEQGRLSVIRAPFMMKTRQWYQDPEEVYADDYDWGGFSDMEEIDWVFSRTSI